MIRKAFLTFMTILLLVNGDIRLSSWFIPMLDQVEKKEDLRFYPLLATTTWAALSSDANQPESQPQKQKGISYATWWSGNYSHPDADLALANLADTGADWISLIVTQYQDSISSTDVYPTLGTPTDADLVHVIRQAHHLGLKVMLKPHLDLAHDPDHWRGEIGQDFSESEWNAWFSSYQAFIDHYAQLAQTYGADQFCVGTELSATQGREGNWRAVIGAVRSLYDGPLTYAANHGSENDLTWWDAVDYIGVDAYYPLTDKNDPTIAELKAAWQPRVSSLATLASTWNKSIIFTEIGYRSQDGTNQQPWASQLDGEIDLQEQADAYQAAFESVYHQPWLAGIYWWDWRTDPFAGGPCDKGRTPYDKPAEDVLRYWYGAAPRVDRPTPQAHYDQTLDIYLDDLGSAWENWSWNAEVDFSSNDHVYNGTQAISVDALAWGALSLYHSSFDSAPYYWLEFYLRKSTPDLQLTVFAHNEHNSALRNRPVEDCRYTDEQPIEPEVWTRVRIPLSHLDASERLLQRVSIMNYSSQPAYFWIDEMRLLGGAWHVYLPALIWDMP